jgi:trehalose synthase
VYEVHITPRPIDPFADLVGPERFAELQRRVEELRARLGTRTVWNVSSTAAGGGVAEMLRSYVRYARGSRIDTRWLVLEANPQFFRVTKRIHNALHSSAGDGSPLGPEQAALYRDGLHDDLLALERFVQPGDVVICHDPQTAGLVPRLMQLGAKVVWRCHIGRVGRNEEVDRAWAFLRPYLEDVPHTVFTRSAFAPEWLHARTIVLQPNIDPFSAKNYPMAEEAVHAILVKVGLLTGPPTSKSNARFVRDDGSLGRVDHKVEMLSFGPPPTWETPLVVQVSRWDAMKDPVGVLEGFAYRVAEEMLGKAHLVLAGSSLRAIADDPESAEVFGKVECAWRALPEELKRMVHLALLPMEDLDENAAIVNALQRHAAVIVQKSLREGFGLTVTEAMWKGRPVVASAVGGIQDQIRDGTDGLLLRSPAERAEFGAAVCRVLTDDGLARRLGEAAHARVLDNYLVLQALSRWSDSVELLA